MTNDLQQLVKMSNEIGIDPAFVQGGGGNTSVKLNAQEMYVKASGIELCNVTEQRGFALIQLDKLRQYLKNPDYNENIFASTVASFSINGQRPSIETGFHALLKERFVLHSHSVYTNVLCCASTGELLAKEIFGDDCCWVDYATPGVAIVAAFMKTIGHAAPAKFILLKNHGLVTFGNTYEETMQNHINANKIITDYFQLPDFSVKEKGILPEQFLFPDQLVYHDVSPESKAYIETYNAYVYIYENIKRLGLQHSFIPMEKFAEIKNMDSEKYRKKIIE